MKGIILNLLEGVVTDVHGAVMWDDLLDRTGLDGAYSALGNYPDAEVVALISALAAATDQPADEVLRWFGREAIPPMVKRYPDFFTPSDPVAFVLTLHDVIHSEVMKLYPGATPPELSFSQVDQNSLAIDYRSSRGMSDLAIGFLRGAADHYGTSVAVDREMLPPGDGTHVRLRCTFGVT